MMQIECIFVVLILVGGEITAGQNDGFGFDYQLGYEPVTDSSNQVNSTLDDVSADFDGVQRWWPQKDSMSSLDTALFVVYTLVTFFGLIGNILVFFIIIAGNEIGKTVTTIYVLQLTIADTVFLITLPIFSAQKLNAFNEWTFGEGMCTISQTIKYCNYYAGMFFLTAMSVDRYVALAYNSKLNQIRTKTTTYIVCGLVWIMAGMMSIPILLYARIEDFGGITHCRVMFPGYTQNSEPTYVFSSEEGGDTGYVFEPADKFDNSSYTGDQMIGVYVEARNFSQAPYYCQYEYQSQVYKTWLVFHAIIAFIIPFGVIVAMYTMIMLRMRRVEHNVARARSGGVKNKRLTKMVAALVSCFAICWLPYHILSLARIAGFPSTMMACHGMEEFFTALAFSNSALNPMLYTFMGIKFKERFKRSAHNVRMSIITRQGSRGQSSYRTSRYNIGEEVTKRDTTVV